MPPQRLVRRRPLSQRMQAFLNPMDFYLWLSEEIQTFDWDSNGFGTKFGLGANFVYLIARANIVSQRDDDDVFGDAPANSLLTWLVHTIAWTLLSISCLNAFYALTRSRTYRLFEANVETKIPSTPSAHRVRVDSTPGTFTPLRFILDFFKNETAEERAHPDKSRDVWELQVWDPYPATLRMFCLFSPGHILIYMLFLPLDGLDQHPSLKVFKILFLQAILSVQLLITHSRYTQQAKDTAIIQREVMHEYDTKFVHPRLNPVYRDVATQVSINTNDSTIEQETIAIGTPLSVIRRGFKTYPNPNYAKYVDPEGIVSSRKSPSPFTPLTSKTKPKPITPGNPPLSFARQLQQQSALRHNLPPQSQSQTTQTSTTDDDDTEDSIAYGESAATPYTSRAVGGLSPAKGTPLRTSTGVNPLGIPQSTTNFGGSMGLYTHKDSPLKKTLGVEGITGTPRNNREMAAMEQRQLAERMIRAQQQASPLKRRTGGLSGENLVPAHSPEKLANLRANRWTQERFPTRRI
ncbi:hypothetical protein QBC44DRAFT_323360 [Cladorrhinum sp. PSN332]|nr:hypothetical protein QBC44DRAFT_323360 [Cladorrhinum sp. PSN332]